MNKTKTEVAMPNQSIIRGNVHPLADSPLLEFPLSDHAFNPNPCNGEICRDCGRMRALHIESDTVNPFRNSINETVEAADNSG